MFVSKLSPEKEISSFEEDVFGFGDDVMRLARVLENAESATFLSLYATWGSGKSSYLRMLESAFDGKAPDRETPIESHEKILPVFFDSWDHENPQGLLPALMANIGSLVSERGGTLKDALKKSFRNVAGTLGVLAANWTAKITTAGLIDVEQIVDAYKIAEGMNRANKSNLVSELANDPHTKLKRDLKEALKFTKESGIDKIVVLIDDLDRCHPENIFHFLDNLRRLIAIIESVSEGDDSGAKIVGIMAADEAIINMAIRQKYEGLAKEPSSYLYKLVSAAFQLPKPKKFGYKKLIRARIEESGIGKYIPLSVADKFSECAEADENISARHLTTLLRTMTVTAPTIFDLDDVLSKTHEGPINGCLPFCFIAIASPEHFKLILNLAKYPDDLNELLNQVVGYFEGNKDEGSYYRSIFKRNVKEDWQSFSHLPLIRMNLLDASTRSAMDSNRIKEEKAEWRKDRFESLRLSALLTGHSSPNE